MGVMTTGSYTKALWPGINKWYGGTYTEWQEEYGMLFDMESSTKAYEEEVGVTGFGLALEKAEGSPVQYDEARQAFIHRYVHKTFALGFIVTEELIEDNQYNLSTIGKKDAQALAFSMRQTKEILAANVYNRAFDTNYTFGDGKAILVADHPTFVGSSYSNVPTVALDLSEAALEQAVIDIKGFKNDRGMIIQLLPKKLIIPRQLEFEAIRILKSTLQNDSGNNAINALKDSGSFAGGVSVNHYLTDADAWFIRTNCQNGMKGFNRRETKFAVDQDFDTSNSKFKASFRISFGVTDPRGLYGSPGA